MKLEIADLTSEQWLESSIEKHLFHELFEGKSQLNDNDLDLLAGQLEQEEHRIQQALVSQWEQVRQNTDQSAQLAIADCQVYLQDVQNALEYTSKVDELDKRLSGLMNELEQTKSDIAAYEKRVFIEEKISDYRNIVRDMQVFKHDEFLNGKRLFKQYFELLSVLKATQNQLSEPSLKLYLNESMLWMGFEYDKSVENLGLLVERVLESFILLKHDRESNQVRIVLLNRQELVSDVVNVLEKMRLWHIFDRVMDQSLNEKILNSVFSRKCNLILAGESDFMLETAADGTAFKDLSYVYGWLELYWKLMETVINTFNAEKMKTCVTKYMLHDRLDEIYQMFEDALPSDVQALEEYKVWIKEKFENGKYNDLKPVLAKLLESTSGSFLSSRREAYLADIKSLLDRKIDNIIMPEKTFASSKLSTNWQRLVSELKPSDEQNRQVASYSSATSFPTCRITTSCKPLVELFANIIKELKEVSGLSSTDKVKFLTECLGYYRVVSKKLFDTSALEKMPQQGMLFHNDAFYIAHSLIDLLSGLDLDGKWAESAIVSELNALYQHANEIYRRTLDTQFGEVKRIVGELKSHLSRTLSDESRDEIERLLKQAKYQITLLTRVLKPVLSWYQYLSIISGIAGEIQSCLADAVLDLDDLEERECEYLCQMIGTSAKTASEGQDAFITQLDRIVSKEIESISYLKQLDKAAIEKPFTPREQKKLEAVMGLLNDPMSETMEKYRRGYFDDAQLQIPRDLIRMLRKVFSDSDRRRAAVEELQQQKK